MSTPAHMLSASYIALTIAHIAPHDVSYILAAIFFSGALDIDHSFFLLKNREFFKKAGYNGNLHKARSFFHEQIGLFCIGLLMFIVSFFNMKLSWIIGIAMIIHLAEDVLMGISIPFNFLDKSEISIIRQSKLLKVIVDLIIIIIFSFLWTLYLKGLR